VVDFLVRIDEHGVGDEIPISAVRNGRGLEVRIKLAQIPKPDGRKLARTRLGIEIQEIDQQLAGRLGVRADAGLVVTSVDENGPAARRGIQPGDILVRIANRGVHTYEEVGETLEKVSTGDRVKVYVYRPRSHFLVGVTLQAR
jgi:serine protease Do